MWLLLSVISQQVFLCEFCSSPRYSDVDCDLGVSHSPHMLERFHDGLEWSSVSVGRLSGISMPKAHDVVEFML